MRFERLLWLDHAELVETAMDERARTVEICAKPATGEAEWLRHAGAHARVIDGPAANMQTVCIPKARTRDRRRRSLRKICTVRARLWAGVPDHCAGRGAAGTEFWGRIAVDADNAGEAGQWHLHPAILDGALQLALASVPPMRSARPNFCRCTSRRVLWLRPANGEVLCRVSNVHHQDVRSYADIELFTPTGEPVAAMYGSCCLRKEQAYRLASSPVCLYREEWVETEGGSTRTGGDEEAWVVCGDSASGALTAAMTAAGSRAVPCGFSDLPPDAGRIIVCAWTGEHIEPSAETVLDAAWPLVQLAQSLAAHPRPVRLLLVTAGATWGQPGGGSRVDLQQATLAALLRAMATELPQVQCRLLDLDPATPEQHVAQTLRELRSDAHESEVSYRGGRRFAQRDRTKAAARAFATPASRAPRVASGLSSRKRGAGRRR